MHPSTPSMSNPVIRSTALPLLARAACLQHLGRIHAAVFSDPVLHSELLGKAVFWQQASFYGIDMTPLHTPAVEGYFAQVAWWLQLGFAIPGFVALQHQALQSRPDRKFTVSADGDLTLELCWWLCLAVNVPPWRSCRWWLMRLTRPSWCQTVPRACLTFQQ